MAEEIGQKPVGIVPTDRTEDHIDRRVAEGITQVGGAGFGVGGDVIPAAQRVRAELHLHAPGPQALQPDFELVAHKILAQGTGRKADDADGFDLHGSSPLFLFDRKTRSRHDLKKRSGTSLTRFSKSRRRRVSLT